MSKQTTRTNAKNLIRAAFLLLPLGAALTSAPSLQAQNVTFAGVQSTILDSGMDFPTSVAVDGAGNVLIADDLNNRVLKVSPTGVESVVASGLKLPQGVAADTAGNVFIADTFNNRVLKVSPAGAQSTAVSGLLRPQGVALDAAGNLFIADAYNDRVLKVAPNGAQTMVAGGLNRPGAVAVDGSGNVYIADTMNNRVLKVLPDGTQILVSRSLYQPFGVAVDGAGNVFIADSNDLRVVEISPNGTQTSIGSGLRYPYGVAVDQAGSIYIADSDHNRVLELQRNAVNFGSLNICPSGQSSPAPCSRSFTLNYHIGNSGNLGTPVVSTQGAPNLDFKLAGSTCTGAVTGGASCTVNVTFAPVAPGARLGGVEITDNGGKVLATTMIYGQGQGAAVAFGPGVQTTLASGLSSPAGVAVDTAGNTYIADFARHRVLKISPGGAQTEVGTGLRFPSAVAVDGAGDVFISETGNNRVVKVRTHGGEQTTVAEGLNLPQSIAVDGAGNLFIADYGNNRVLKIIAAGGAQLTVGRGLKLPYGVAVDGAGNAFIADYGNDRVLKVSAQGVQTQLPVPLNFPTAVAVDAAGNVLVGDTSNNRVLLLPSDGSPFTTVATGLSHPQGVATDGAGNIYIADSSNNRLVELQRSRPPALSFSSTLVGKSNGPQPLTIWNIGNQRLIAVAPGIAIGSNFQESFGGTAPAGCTRSFSLRPGGGCDLSISFVPQTSGNLQSTVVLTDNALNAATATQTISLSGIGVAPTTITVQAVTGQYSDPVALTAVIGPAGLNFSGSLQFHVAGVPACSVAVTGSGTYSCNYTITSLFNTIDADLTSADSFVQGSSGSKTMAITREDATISPSSLNPKIVRANATTGEASQVALEGTLQQAGDGSPGDLNHAVAIVTLVTGSSFIACDVTNNSGAVQAVCNNVPVGSYTVRWQIGGNYYTGPTVTTALTVTH